jgi:hypothetical protein
MVKLGRKVFVGVLAAGFLLSGSGLLNASTVHAATGQGNSRQIESFQAGKGNQGQLNVWPQSAAFMWQQPFQLQFNRQQSKQQQPDQQQPQQQAKLPQPDQQQPNQQQFVPEGQRFGFGGGNLIAQVAEILDVEEQTIIDELKDGKSLAEIAEDYGVSEDELLEELEELQSDAIDDAVADGTLTEDQADELRDRLAERLEEIVTSTLIK